MKAIFRKEKLRNAYRALSLIHIWWGDVWVGWADAIFGMGWLIPQVGATCLIAGGAVLFVYRLLKERFIADEE